MKTCDQNLMERDMGRCEKRRSKKAAAHCFRISCMLLILYQSLIQPWLRKKYMNFSTSPRDKISFPGYLIINSPLSTLLWCSSSQHYFQPALLVARKDFLLLQLQISPQSTCVTSDRLNSITSLMSAALLLQVTPWAVMEPAPADSSRPGNKGPAIAVTPVLQQLIRTWKTWGLFPNKWAETTQKKEKDFRPICLSPYAISCKHNLWSVIPATAFGQK